MRTQIFDRPKKTMAILLLVLFVVSLTGIATSTQASQVGCPRGYHQVGPTGPNGRAICEPDQKIDYREKRHCYDSGYSSGYNDGARACTAHLGYIPDTLRKMHDPASLCKFRAVIYFNKGYHIGFQKGWMNKGCLV
jgi:hypothetical protein